MALYDKFANHHVVEGQKLADSLLKRLQSEDPRSAMIAAAQIAAFAARACGLTKHDVQRLMETLMNAIYNPTVETAQEAASRLILPGRL